MTSVHHRKDFPRWFSGKESACQCRTPNSIPGSGNDPWRRKCLSTPVFLPGKCHGQRSLASYSPTVQFSRSVVSPFATPSTTARQASLSITRSRFTQTHVHCVGDANQPSHPLLSPSPPALNLSQHQGLFKLVSSPHQVAKVLKFQLQHQTFQ